MWALIVVLFNECFDGLPRLIEGVKTPKPKALTLEGAEPPFDHPILFRCIGRDVLLPEACSS